MKKLIFLILFLVVLVFASQRIFISACDTPIHYKIDTVDAQFNLSKDKFIAENEKAAEIWNKVYGKNLLTYDPNGTLSINLIYDTRQLLDSQINNLQGQLNNEKNSLDPQIAQYKKDLQSFQSRATDLNNQITSWNQKGGAPPDVYNQLIQQQNNLQQEADRLNAEAKNLNLTTQNFNLQVGNLNQKVDIFNTAIGQRPEEGIYIAKLNRIEVYFDITETELLHTLAHEMGHAIGLDHNPNSKSIMFPKTNDVIIPSSDDLNGLTAICAPKNLFDTALLKIKARFNLQQ